MCGRFYIPDEDSNEELQRIINHLNRVKSTPVKTGEVCPTDVAAVIANSKAMNPTPFAMKWGYTMDNRAPIINARSESAAEKPLFRDGMQQRRCLIPASSYFEWEHAAGRKIKHAIRPAGSEMMYLAGIYHLEHHGDVIVPAFAILTREAADGIRFIHARMPVILPESCAMDWLNPENEAHTVLAHAAQDMRSSPV